VRLRVFPTLLPLLATAVACAGGESEPPREPPAASVAAREALRCPLRPATTLALEACAAERRARLDRAIAEKRRSILARPISAGARRRFLRAEQAWRRHRRARCESRADVYEGGSAARVVLGECMADESAAHLRDLRAFERDLRRGRV
jgi:uncharacterized protein YecT (DUF1311 family)